MEKEEEYQHRSSSNEPSSSGGGLLKQQLARSKSRGRNPSELLARKQQLISDQLEASGAWTPQADHPFNENQQEQQQQHRRSQIRRARQLELNRMNMNHHENNNEVNDSNDVKSSDKSPTRSREIEAKLESLSELLKNHQRTTSQLEENSPPEQNCSSPSYSNENNDKINQNNKTSPSSTTATSIENVYILLAKKEKDLQLAAELGKVLLEKNDELSKANEAITENYSHKLELLEQEKHKLKRKLDLLDGEYENRLVELQTDCNILKNQLEEQQQLAKKKEKETSKLIDDLVQQNQRLTSELVEATKSEELLSKQLEQTNERFNVRLSNRQDHVTQLEGLKEEIQIVNQRKQDLERRLKLANNDKSNLNVLLEETSDKILLLENLLNEKEAKLNELLDEINELRDSSSWLSNELESMIMMNEKLSTNSSSLLNKNNANDDEAATKFGLDLAACQRKRSQLVEQLKELRLKNQSRLKANEFLMIKKAKSSSGSSNLLKRTRLRRTFEHDGDDNRRGDESLFAEMNNMVMTKSDRRSSDLSGSPDQDQDLYDHDGEENNFYHQERRFEVNAELLIEIYNQLHNFYNSLQLKRERFQNNNSTSSAANSSSVSVTNHHHLTNNNSHLYSPNSADDSGISGDDIDNNKLVPNSGATGATTATTNNGTSNFFGHVNNPNSWKQLLESLKCLIEELPCSSCHLMIAERSDYEQLQKTHSRLSEELKKKEEELFTLKAFKLEQETKLLALEERCEILQGDLENCDTKPKEEIVKLAWKARDDAVERKNNAEISLAKTRIENMQISSQLMEVVQQKGELSQKLAQFEDDIHYITQDSVKAKFTWEEYAEKLRRNAANTTSSSNPLAQLLNFSYPNVVASTTTRPTSATTLLDSARNKVTITSGEPIATDNIGSQSASNLMRNFASNKFNLKFWQRSSQGESNETTKQKQQQTANELDNKAKSVLVNNQLSNNRLAAS